MTLRSALRRWFAQNPPSDQTYHEATVENAMMDRDNLTARIVSIAENGHEINKGLRAGVERIKQTAEKPDVLADLVQGMKSDW